MGDAFDQPSDRASAIGRSGWCVSPSYVLALAHPLSMPNMHVFDQLLPSTNLTKKTSKAKKS
jgi:hypothetical protein